MAEGRDDMYYEVVVACIVILVAVRRVTLAMVVSAAFNMRQFGCSILLLHRKIISLDNIFGTSSSRLCDNLFIPFILF